MTTSFYPAPQCYIVMSVYNKESYTDYVVINHHSIDI